MKRRNLLWIVLLILVLCGIGVWLFVSGDSSSEVQVAEEPKEAPAIAAAPEAPEPAAAPALEPVPESEPAPAVEDEPAPAKTAARAPRRAPNKTPAAEQETQESQEEVYEPSRDEAAGTAVSKQDELPPPDDAAAATEQATPLVQGTTTSVFRNKVGSWYRLQKVTCYIDGVEAFVKAGDFKEAELFDGPLPLGEHVFTVVAEYQGEGGALFSYLDGYGFNVKAGRNFNVEADREAKIEVTAYERRGATTKFEDRLALSIEIK